jgi:hypothetical protein
VRLRLGRTGVVDTSPQAFLCTEPAGTQRNFKQGYKALTGAASRIDLLTQKNDTVPHDIKNTTAGIGSYS